MANTWIATPLNSDERVAQFRSTDFDPRALYERLRRSCDLRPD
jgi:hypothetical protein